VKWNRSDWLCVVGLGLAVLLIGTQRAGLAEAHRRVTGGRDAYVLPPPQQTVVMSLGYRAAAADLIFGHVLVAVGTHMAEKRLFEFAPEYIETINELDPKFRDPYRYSDAILTLQTVQVPLQMYDRARTILLRGTRELPYDQQLWASAGQFLAYLAAGQLQDRDPTKAEQFRQEGARLLAHACELIGSNENIPYQCLTAASLFSDAGNREASRQFLEKLLVVSDDPDLHAIARAKLAQLAGEDARKETFDYMQRFERAWRDDLPFVSQVAIAALGPDFDAAACAGKRELLPGDPCATSLNRRMAPPEEAR
jgi:hypothetical protein